MDHTARRILPFDGRTQGTQQTQAAAGFKQRLHLKSLERGYHTKQVVAGNVVDGVKRTLWDQERHNKKKVVGGPPVAPATPPIVDENPAGGDLIDVPETGARMRQLVLAGEDAQTIGDMFPVDEHVFDYVLEHSLGFQNRSYGEFYNAAEDTNKVPVHCVRRTEAAVHVHQCDNQPRQSECDVSLAGVDQPAVCERR